MHVSPLQLPEVLVVEPRVFADARGAFLETWNEQVYAGAGITGPFVQDNLSLSALHTLRGLHYQVEHAHGKLVRVVRGEIYDVVVDLRRTSPRFGQWAAVTLRAAAQRALWVPPGFAHGFLATADDTWVQYKVTDYWAPQHERTLAWDDPALGIPWPLPVGTPPLLSAKDAEGRSLADADVYP